MELVELAERINNFRQMEQMADKPSASFDPSDGMDTVSELKDYVRFLFKHLQEKDATIQEMAADLKALRQKDSDYQKLLEQVVRQNEEMHQLVSENNRLNQAVVKLSEQLALQQKHRFSGHSQKKKKASGVPSGETASDRQKDEDDFDGGDNPIPNDEVPANIPDADMEEKHPTGIDEFRKGRKYNTMSAVEVVLHKSDVTLLPEGSIFLGMRIRRAYEQVLKIIQHEYQMVVYQDKDGKILETYLPVDGASDYVDRFPGTHASASYMAHLGFSKYEKRLKEDRNIANCKDFAVLRSRIRRMEGVKRRK